jgi:uncharacterized protein (TIGR02001 family)
MQTSIRGLLAATLLAGSALAATPALADDAPAAATPPAPITITGTAAIVSQYRFRGLSQSDNRPAFQGSITVAHSSGFYLATWGSSASAGTSEAFNFDNGDVRYGAPINIGGTEIDVYGGFTHAIGKTGLTFDGGLYGYLYPGAPSGNYFELYGSMTYAIKVFTIKGGVNFAPDQGVFNYNFTSPSHQNWYFYGELGASIPHTPLSFHSHLGHTAGGFDYGKSYLDWTVGLTYKWKVLALDVSWVGTNLSQNDITNGFNCFYTPAEGVTSVDGGCTNYYHRMSKDVGVVSLTASF